ncbi:MAG: type IV secretory system conjugative DNA transfer family protein [Acidimicrobiales bacterium]
MVLDEGTNYPLPSLPSLISEGGGSGITTLAVLQFLAQARDRWGREAAQAIWDSAIVKIVLGGSANADDLADFCRLIGEHVVTEWSETRQAHAPGRSVSSSTRWRPILEPAELRRLRFGTGLLLLRSAPPIICRCVPGPPGPTPPPCRRPARRGVEGRRSMREPRPGLVWSPRRARRRAAYASWIQSPA